MKSTTLIFLLVASLPTPLVGRSCSVQDTVIALQTPLLLKSSVLFSNRLIGGQCGLGRVVSWKEKHILKRSGKERVITKGRVLSGNIVYYYNPGLHQNWMLTAQYAMYRSNKKGFYTEFTPLLGVSRTFLPGTAYKVDDAGKVSIDKVAGNWTLTGGFGLGAGKYFNQTGNLKAISVNLVTQVFYPNFHFIALKPYFSVTTTWSVSGTAAHINKRIKFIFRNGAK